MPTYSPPTDLGITLPEFHLPSTSGSRVGSGDLGNFKALCVMFICNHCPYVLAVEDRLIQLARELEPQGIRFIAISSNDAIRYPEDSFEKMQERAIEKKYPFPYLFDESQEVAKKFDAVCTPDFFAYGADRKLAYRGRLDDSWKDPSLVQTQELKLALGEIALGQAPTREQKSAMGCSIKWKT